MHHWGDGVWVYSGCTLVVVKVVCYNRPVKSWKGRRMKVGSLSAGSVGQKAVLSELYAK